MNDHHKNEGSFGTGFLLGIVVGALLVFLFATKKGKKLLKTITEEGLEGIGEFEELLDDDEGYEDVVEEDQARPQGATDNGVRKLASKTRRFFRGTSRKR